MRVKTRPTQILSETASRTMYRGAADVADVLVDGQLVGMIAKNKYGVWIGTDAPVETLSGPTNPFVARGLDHWIAPSRRKREAAENVANRVRRS